jgi:hypothetical protein
VDEKDFFEDRASMLDYYGIQAAEFRMRHDAIFSEIKHYSWLISTLLISPPIALFLGKEVIFAKLVLPYLIPIPILGIAFSVISFFVIRREFHYYNGADARLLFLEKQLGVTSRPDFRDDRLLKATTPGFNVKHYIESERPLGTLLPWKARIRTLFLMEFWLFGLVGTIQVCFALAFLSK